MTRTRKRVKTDAETPSSWEDMINLAVKAIVSIRFAQPVAFDSEDACTSEATGFVVDAERGIILTNRHGTQNIICLT